MTSTEKVFVQQQRYTGASYAAIAAALGVSLSTVKSFCYRNGLSRSPTNKTAKCDVAANACKQCGKSIAQTHSGKPKKFCSDTCRMAWWSANRDSLQKRAVYYFTCAQCGREFESYGNQRRKYCCHACYVQARFGTEKGREADEPRAI